MEGRFKARGLRVVAVAPYDEEPDEDERAALAEAAVEEKMTYPTFLDVGGGWSEALHLDEIPAFAVVDRSGHVVLQIHAALTEGSDGQKKVNAAIEQAL